MEQVGTLDNALPHAAAAAAVDRGAGVDGGGVVTGHALGDTSDGDVGRFCGRECRGDGIARGKQVDGILGIDLLLCR